MLNLELTQDEADILHFILRNVGGSESGPRRYIDSILAKFRPEDHNPVHLYSATTPSKPDPKLHNFYIEDYRGKDTELPS